MIAIFFKKIRRGQIMKNKLLVALFFVLFLLGGCARNFSENYGTPGNRWIRVFGDEIVIVDFVYVKNKNCALNLSVVGKNGLLKSGRVHVFTQNEKTKTSVMVNGSEKVITFFCDGEDMEVSME
jgi:hypothetical protein